MINNQIFRILIVDDEPDAIEFLRYNLKREGYTVLTACNGLEAIQIAQAERLDLIVLDVMMPELDGIQTCKRLRGLPACKNTVIAFLTARNEDIMQVMGLEHGADDYISKPIQPQLLISKIRAWLRRQHPTNKTDNQSIIHIADLEINLENHVIKKNGVSIELPKKEFSLITLLASKPGKVFTRNEILHKIWGIEVIVSNRTIDVHIRKIREKLGEGYIKTIKGMGYKFKVV